MKGHTDAAHPLSSLVRQKKKMVLLKKHIPFYIFLVPAVLHVLIFSIFPIYGVLIAFKDFKMARGILGSNWVGLAHFERIFSDPLFYRVLFNTVKISFLTLLTTFPIAILFALLVNELNYMPFKRTVQTISYLPHFLSWVVVGALVFQVLSPTNGILNSVLVSMGIIEKPLYFMVRADMFIQIYLISVLWKGLGWSIIIYLSTIAGIDVNLYEAAMIDGANRFHRIIYITLPSLLPVISTLLILRMGSLISVGFDAIFNLYTPSTYSVADVISTYVYRRGLGEAKYDYTAAIGLFQNVVSFALVMISNRIAKRADTSYKII